MLLFPAGKSNHWRDRFNQLVFSVDDSLCHKMYSQKIDVKPVSSQVCETEQDWTEGGGGRRGGGGGGGEERFRKEKKKLRG